MEELKGRFGGDPRRRERQERAMREFTSLMRTGSGPFAGEPYHLRWCRIPLAHHFDRVAELIAQARKDGHAAGRISPNHQKNKYAGIRVQLTPALKTGRAKAGGS